MDEIEAIARRRAELAASVQRRLGQRAARDQSAAVSSTPTPVTAPARAAVPQALPAAVASASPAAAVVAVTTPTDRDGDGGSRRDADRTDLRAPEAKRPRPGSGFDKPRDRSPAPFAQQVRAQLPCIRRTNQAPHPSNKFPSALPVVDAVVHSVRRRARRYEIGCGPRRRRTTTTSALWTRASGRKTLFRAQHTTSS